MKNNENVWEIAQKKLNVIGDDFIKDNKLNKLKQSHFQSQVSKLSRLLNKGVSPKDYATLLNLKKGYESSILILQQGLNQSF